MPSEHCATLTDALRPPGPPTALLGDARLAAGVHCLEDADSDLRRYLYLEPHSALSFGGSMGVLVPYVPTPYEVVREMLRLAKVGKDDVVFDLGCGDGRILITAAREFGARAVGIELRKDLVEQCIKNVREAGLEDRILVIEGDFFDFDLSEATVVTLYLLTTVNEKLRPKLERELRPGARVVSHDFEIVGWKPKVSKSIDESYRSHKICLYHV